MSNYIQNSFIGGLNQAVNSTRIKEDEFVVLINGRNRYDVIAPIKLPLLINDPAFPQGVDINYQGVIAAGSFLVVFINGLAFFKNYNVPASNFQQVPNFLMSRDASIIYA